MERVQVLIDKLLQQSRQNADAGQMLITVQLLQNELTALHKKNTLSGTSKVAVVLPVRPVISEEKVKGMVEPIPLPAPKSVEPEEEQTVMQPVAEPVAEKPKKEEYILQKPLLHEVVNEVQPVELSRPHIASIYEAHFDAVSETPTLVQQQPQKEIHELIGEAKESLNDKLKQEKVELVHLLKETPVKDLRKAIGLNDKFVFVNELFRGDEAMYERSIKTINSFHILAEAEYWINRELKVKLGWNDNKEAVQHFYQLVRRRFS